MVEAVEQWGRELGMDQIHGPIGFCDLDQEGMLVEGFDRPSLFFTIYNYPYYTDHMKALGYEDVYKRQPPPLRPIWRAAPICNRRYWRPSTM